jgi:hypothetical protein
MSGPFATAAIAYRGADLSPFPLPPEQKAAPPTGYTGGTGVWISPERIKAWLAPDAREVSRDEVTGERIIYTPAEGNIGLRMPLNLLGIDVDAYGEKAGAATLAKLEKKLGPLPQTLLVTSRDDGISGIRLYEVPEGLHWPNSAGPGIDLITWYHRYVVAEPSIHPEGRKYRWFGPDGIACGYEVIAGWDFEPLPDAWVQHLTQGRNYVDRPAAKLSKAETKAAIEHCPEPGGDPCGGMRRTLDYWLPLIRESEAGGAHDTALRASNAVVRDARKGHRGVVTGLDAVSDAFYTATADRRRDEREWGRMVDGAVKKAVAALPKISEEDTECELDFSAQPTDEAVEAMLAELLDFDALESIPESAYLIKGLFDLDSLAQVFGQSGHRKSFVMLDISCHVSLGFPWCGHRVRRGPVVYIAAEGAKGIKKRLRAWAKYHGKKPKVLVLPRPVVAEEWAVLVEALRRIKPVLVVGDTQARLTSGMDENSAKEIGPFIDRLDNVRRATGACVVVVHHEGLATGRTRGSTAQKGALEHQFRVFTDADTGQTVFSDEKQKDSASAGDLRFDPLVVSVGVDSDGDPITSLVLVQVTGLAAALGRVDEIRSQYQRKITEIVALAPYEGMTKTEIRSLFNKECDKRRFVEAWDALCKKEAIAPVGKTAKYRLAGIDGR